MAGYALLKGYFEIVLAQVLYQWNRLEEARAAGCERSCRTPPPGSSLICSAWGYAELIQVELARGERSAVPAQRCTRWNSWCNVSAMDPSRLAAQHCERSGGWRRDRLKEASDWAASVVFPEGPWEGSLYDAFPVVMRVYFAELRLQEALELLERLSGLLDRPANMAITITYLAQSLVALHHAGQSEQAHEIAARLFALTEPEGYLRVYLDEGEPMRQALLALLTSHSQQA